MNKTLLLALAVMVVGCGESPVETLNTRVHSESGGTWNDWGEVSLSGVT